MPPEVPYCRSLGVPLVRSTRPVSPETNLQSICIQKYCQRTKTMNFTKKKLIPFLVLILATISILRLLRITVTTYSSPTLLSAFPPTLQTMCPSDSPGCTQVSRTPLNASLIPSKDHLRIDPNVTALTEKEFLLLANLVTNRAPCNLLFFGLQPEYLIISSINAGGTTIFLEDDPSKVLNMKQIDSNTMKIYKVEYSVPAKDAYKLLKHARKNMACANVSGKLRESTCQLALRNLPQEVYELVWDVVVVDGPSGDAPEAPGRMAAIYTAATMARKGNVTAVLVHDVDRMIERWFSWEFLCDENLVSSKGKLWNFRIRGQLNSTLFCPSKPVILV